MKKEYVRNLKLLNKMISTGTSDDEVRNFNTTPRQKFNNL